MSQKYAVIAAHRAEYPVRLMCRTLGVLPAGFYAAQTRAPSARAQADARLRVDIQAAFTQAQQRYGSPRVHHQLRRRGVRVSAKRVARLMQEDGLVARSAVRRARTTDSAHAWPLAPNLVARDFTVARPVDTTWVADITFVPTRAGWLYLAVVLDLASRRVLGWATSAQNDAALAVTAAARALAIRRPAAGLVHHSDRGSVYASHAYRALLAQHDVRCSMSRRGDCWDNAVAESFFATLEWELLATHRFASHVAATRALGDFIDGWYNRERLHSTLGYQSPVDYEHDLRRTPHAA